MKYWNTIVSLQLCKRFQNIEIMGGHCVLVLCLVLGFANYHAVNGVTLEKVLALVKELQQQRKDQASATTPAPPISQTSDAEFLQKLDIIEGRVKAIKIYLMGEKNADRRLREKSNKVITEMKSKITETDDVIGELREVVKNTLIAFDDNIVDVNKTAHVKVNAYGAVLYGGVGSACSAKNGECATANSECRGGKCQCIPGFSFDRRDRECKSACDSYGATYQTVDRRIIRGYNELTLEESELQDCIDRCNTETSFVCRSFDFFPRWHTCYLSTSVKTDVAEELWEYNKEGYHFQRDCKF